ncbi:hypothetical protein DUNSADRAFT_13699 [Dunaliella salina]|uniref:ER membrane protein complex subunit 1 n=1 Tax=Dunaliella salina TaxID=3046 RepID=A0ABQ7H346_DUNSA|nr:hypothetical protein DUNSADRAFT_13699 [Dunaliella salina]|eukprot:KAF5841245.1 hypothetical protein DUNSADRAFT_13699 [Dunaliella salina]
MKCLAFSHPRDSRGFRKLIVVATEAGKVAALHNGDGHIVWSRPFPRKLAPQQLLQWQLFHDLTHAPRVAALHSGSSGSILTVLDAHTGAALEEVKLPGRVDKLVGIGTLSISEGVEQSVYLAVELPETTGATPRVTLLPDTPVARDFFVAQQRSLFFWTESAAAHTAPSTLEAPALQGYGFDGTAAEAALSGAPIHAVRTWSLAFPQPLLAVAARDPKEPTHSSVKVLGDRSIKYRYLNLNTMVVVTGLAPGVWVDPDEQDSIQATIHIVDSASGHVLHHQLQPYARGPAAAVITDNMAAVQLWDASAARFALTSLELFDVTPREFSVLDALFNPNATQPVTSFNPPPLEVISASFFTRTPARSFGVTRTRAGITSKQLLARTIYDQVYAIDPRYIDPRRPKKTKLTAQEMEERLLPYQDTLPVNSLSFVTYDKQQSLSTHCSIRGPSPRYSTWLRFSDGLHFHACQVHAHRLRAPTSLSHVAAPFKWTTLHRCISGHGFSLPGLPGCTYQRDSTLNLLMQYTRVSPAKGFDTLDDDFNYGLLLTALLVLSTASVVAHFYTKSTSLAAKWK